MTTERSGNGIVIHIPSWLTRFLITSLLTGLGIAAYQLVVLREQVATLQKEREEFNAQYKEDRVTTLDWQRTVLQDLRAHELKEQIRSGEQVPTHPDLNKPIAKDLKANEHTRHN